MLYILYPRYLISKRFMNRTMPRDKNLCRLSNDSSRWAMEKVPRKDIAMKRWLAMENCWNKKLSSLMSPPEFSET